MQKKREFTLQSDGRSVLFGNTSRAVNAGDMRLAYIAEDKSRIIRVLKIFSRAEDTASTYSVSEKR